MKQIIIAISALLLAISFTLLGMATKTDGVVLYYIIYIALSISFLNKESL